MRTEEKLKKRRLNLVPSLSKNRDGSTHIHTYIRANKSYDKKDKNRYKCADPYCNHWAWRHDLKGKVSLCSVCRKKEIVLDYENLRLSYPRCLDCGNSKRARQLREIKEALVNEFGVELDQLDLQAFSKSTKESPEEELPEGLL